MIAIGCVTNIFQRGAASMGRLNYILRASPNIRTNALFQFESAAIAAEANGQGRARPSQVKDQVIADSTDSIHGEIEFRHLNFAYPGPEGIANPTVLHDINLHIPAGSTLAIVGPTGGGKSTLASLIARLWEAPADTLFLDGRSIRDYPLDSLRRAIGYVPQDTFLFSETLSENIAFGVDQCGRRRSDGSCRNRRHFR